MYTFLPAKPPLKTFRTNKKSLNNISQIASELPKLLLTNKVQSKINNLSKNSLSVNCLITVSYTHLTLPTILLV